MYSLGIVTKAFLGIILTLDSWIYSLISSAYKIFMAIASARILSSDAYTAIANKVYIIIGVGMLFVLAYAIMKAIIDPDQMSKGDMAGGKILKSIAIAVIGLIVTPLIFDLAYMAQGKMLEDDILGKIFFRTEDSVEKINAQDGSSYTFNYDQELHETGGAVAATSVWQAFFYPADGEDPTKIMADPDVVRMNANIAATACAGTLLIGIAGAIGGFFTGGAGWVVAGAAVASCVGAYVADSNADQVEQAIDEEVSLAEAFTMVSSGKTGFAVFQAFLDPIDEGQIKYTWFISTVCGAFVAYAFVSYAIDMGLRAAKLAYYQIIAPIPLILGVLPKNGDRVGKFAKAVFSTFLEVFVRISVVYIVIYIIAHLNELFSTVGALWDSENLTTVESMIAMALLIIGLVLFAKQAPKIISDTFGLNAGGLEGLNIMKKLRDGEVFTAGTIAGSTIRSGVQGAVAGWRRNDGKKFHQKLLGAAGSSLAGAASGGVRSGIGRARSGKPVGGVREMRDNIDRETRTVADKRRERERFMKENPTMGRQIAAKWDDVKTAGYRWAVGDTDTSYDDGYLSTFKKIQNLRDDLRAKTAKDPNVQAAQELYDRLLKKNIGDYDEDAYAAAIKAASDAVDANKARGAYIRNMTAFNTDLAREMAAIDADTTLSAADKTRRKDEKRAELIEAHLDTDKYNKAKAAANASVDKEAYRYTDERKAELESQLLKDRKRAKDNLEATQDAAASRLIANGDPALTEVLTSMVTSNMSDLQKYANESFTVTAQDGSTSTRTLADMMNEMGINLRDGTVNTATTVSGGNTIQITYVPDPSRPDVTATEVYTIDNSGNMTDARGNAVDPSRVAYMVEHQNGEVKNNSKISLASDDVKKAGHKKRTDKKYLADQARKRTEQEKKK